MPVGLQVKIGADVTGLMGAFQAAAGGAGSLGETLKATVASMHPAAAAGVAVADALIGMTEAAAADRAEQEKLNTLYENATGVTGDYTTAVNAAIDAGAEKAFSDSEVRAGLEGLITATGNADDANKLLAQAMDISRAAGVDLETAANAVAKAHEGQDEALRKLFPGMEKQATAADTITEATKLSTGAADDYAKSAEGMGKRGQDAFGELGEKVGSAFLPIMDELLPALLPFVELLGELITAVLPPLKIGIGFIVDALKILIDIIKGTIDVIKEIIKWIQDMIALAQNAVGAVSGAIDAINPFAVGGGGGAPAAQSRSVGGGGGGGGAVIINITGDPVSIERSVLQSLRTYSRRTGNVITGIS